MRSNNKLTEVTIKNLKPKNKLYKVGDGQGLYIQVMPDGSKHWRLRYTYNSKESTLSLGVYPQVSLKKARERARQEQSLILDGLNPSDVRKQNKQLTSHYFEGIAREWYEHHKESLTNAKHSKTVIRQLETYIFPWLGNKSISKIEAREVLETIRKIEAAGTLETSRRTFQNVKKVFTYALAQGLIKANPAAELDKLLKSKEVEGLKYILAPALPQFVAKLQTSNAEPSTLFALKLLMMTFVRPGEIRGALWNEFNFEDALWVIPAIRMKRKREHIVPLAKQTIQLLEELKPINGHYELLFPGRHKDKSISETTINNAIRRLGFNFVGHGFRKTASTWLHEQGYLSDAIERQLSHYEQNKTKAAYDKSEHLELREEMMQAWADFIYPR